MLPFRYCARNRCSGPYRDQLIVAAFEGSKIGAILKAWHCMRSWSRTVAGVLNDRIDRPGWNRRNGSEKCGRIFRPRVDVSGLPQRGDPCHVDPFGVIRRDLLTNSASPVDTAGTTKSLIHHIEK